MFNKKLVAGLSLGVAVLAILGGVFLYEKQAEKPVPAAPAEVKSEPAPVVVKEVAVPKPPVTPQLIVKKADLYNNTDKLIPFSGIADLALLPAGVKSAVDNILENSSNGIFFLKKSGDKIVVIADTASQDEENSKRRHDFEVMEISAEDGKILNDENFTAKEDDTLETWNTSDEDSVKYKKTDKEGNIISIRKETVENQTNLREEHVFYDKDGNMTMNVSFNYDGADLTRFTYYDSEKPEESFMIVNDYENGVKTKETLYSSDYKLQNTYIPVYTDGQKSGLKVLDSANKEIETLEDSAQSS